MYSIVRFAYCLTHWTYNRFLSLPVQTTLHDTVCNRRRLATVATHNLAAITPPLSYSTRPPEEISLLPLGYSKEMTAKAFIALLEANKAPSRGGGGGKKSASAAARKPADPQAAALSKYLDLIQGQSTLAYLSDSAGSVISLPPLTNSSNTMVRVYATRSAKLQYLCCMSVQSALAV